jgi:hypothetical protein
VGADPAGGAAQTATRTQDVTDALAALVIVQQRLSRRKPHRKG